MSDMTAKATSRGSRSESTDSMYSLPIKRVVARNKEEALRIVQALYPGMDLTVESCGYKYEYLKEFFEALRERSRRQRGRKRKCR